MLFTSFVACSTAFVLPTSASVRSAVPKEAKSCSALQLSNRNDDEEVNVNLVPDVDAFTLTAVGFGLIAFNFFVLANVSDHRCRSAHNIPPLTQLLLSHPSTDGRRWTRGCCRPHNEYLWLMFCFGT